MNILIIHAHTANRGDEAAVKAMVDELLVKYPDANITISLTGVTKYPDMPKQVRLIDRFPKVRDRLAQLEFIIAIHTKGKFIITKSGKEFVDALEKADIVIHAPGGPSIGDIYSKVELLYLWGLDFVRKKGKPYMFYAPSMGPFNMKKRNKLRKKILLGAERVIVRDPISLKYVNEFTPEVKVIQTLDSALQHDVDLEINEKKYSKYKELKEFIETHEKCIGITVTDLQWHPSYKDNEVIQNLPKMFNQFISEKIHEGYGIIFIPQLYGANNDTNVMNKYMQKSHTFMVDAFTDEYDSYFQQYVIGKIYAVVGMRYHSNIFSAKMGTPFVSISYEQKMKGFMQSVGLSSYCIDINDLSEEKLHEKFNMLENNYEKYKDKLENIHQRMKNESYKTTQAVIEILDRM